MITGYVVEHFAKKDSPPEEVVEAALIAPREIPAPSGVDFVAHASFGFLQRRSKYAMTAGYGQRGWPQDLRKSARVSLLGGKNCLVGSLIFLHTTLAQIKRCGKNRLSWR